MAWSSIEAALDAEETPPLCGGWLTRIALHAEDIAGANRCSWTVVPSACGEKLTILAPTSIANSTGDSLA